MESVLSKPGRERGLPPPFHAPASREAPTLLWLRRRLPHLRPPPPGKPLTGPLHGMGPLEMGPGAGAVETAGSRQSPQRGPAPSWQQRPSWEPGPPLPQALAAAEEGEGFLRQMASRWRGGAGLPSSPAQHGAHMEPTAQGQTQQTPPQAPQVLRATVQRPESSTGPWVPGRKLGHGARHGAAPRTVGLMSPRCLAPSSVPVPSLFPLPSPAPYRTAGSFSVQTTPSEGPAPKEPPQQNFITD